MTPRLLGGLCNEHTQIIIFLVALATGCSTQDAVFHANDCANLFMEGDFRLALEAGARALHIDPENKPAEVCVGRTHREMKFQTHLLDALNAVGEKDYESALECLERVPTNCESCQGKNQETQNEENKS